MPSNCKIASTMIPQLVLWLYLFSVSVHVTLAARILVVLPFPGKSHHIFGTAIMEALVQRGHHIVEYSPYPPSRPINNHAHVEIHTRFENLLRDWSYQDFIQLTSQHDRTIFGFKIRRVWEMNYEVCEDTFTNPEIQKLLKSSNKFDLVITEATFGEESLLAFGHRFSAPNIVIESFVPWNILNYNTENDLSIASVPDVFSQVFDNEPMTLYERFLNLASTVITLVSYHWIHLPLQDSIINKFFSWSDTPPVADLVSNVSLYFTNSHPAAVNYVHPYTANIIPVGGVHIEPTKSALPKELQDFMDDAKEGVIYFSLGSVVPVHLIPKEILLKFVNVFKRLPQKIVWKIKTDKIQNLPKNIMALAWAPQVSVLQHPDCRLFITHGGLFSHHEATHAGVPVLGIPFFADQPYNLQYNVHRGKGEVLDFHSLTEDSLYQAVTRILGNPKYLENARRLSRVYRDRPLSAADSVVFWVDHVLQFGRPAALTSTRLPWYQRHLIDLFACLALTVLILFILLRIVCSTMCRRKQNNTKKKNR